MNFDKVNYRYFPFRATKRRLKTVYGLDSEAYTTGEPFLFCFSGGEAVKPDKLLYILFTRQYRSTTIFVFNLKYESGAITYPLPTFHKAQLYNEGQTVYEGYTYRYIPHKYLRITKDKHAVHLFDIQPFYGMSLDRAAIKYLGESKLEQDTKQFTPDYVKQNWEHIVAYCSWDALLTAQLASLLISKLAQADIHVTHFYSPASYS